jgi:hypothetical protein
VSKTEYKQELNFFPNVVAFRVVLGILLLLNFLGKIRRLFPRSCQYFFVQQSRRKNTEAHYAEIHQKKLPETVIPGH